MTVPTPEPGDRVRLLRWYTSAVPPGGTKDERGLIRDRAGDVVTIDDNVLVPPGTLGTVRSVDDAGTIHVHWDNRTRLGLIRDRDVWELA